MRLFCEKSNNEIQLVNTTKPTMKHINGRTWDIWTDIFVDGKRTSVYCDTTWGAYGYLKINEKWYKMSIIDVEELRFEENYTLLRCNIVKKTL